MNCHRMPFRCFNIVFQTSSNQMRANYLVHMDELIEERVGSFLQDHFSRCQERFLVVKFRSSILFGRGQFSKAQLKHVNGLGEGSVVYVYNVNDEVHSLRLPLESGDNNEITIQSQHADEIVTYCSTNFENSIHQILKHFTGHQSKMCGAKIVFQINNVFIDNSPDTLMKNIAHFSNNYRTAMQSAFLLLVNFAVIMY